MSDDCFYYVGGWSTISFKVNPKCQWCDTKAFVFLDVSYTNHGKSKSTNEQIPVCRKHEIGGGRKLLKDNWRKWIWNNKIP